MSYYLSLKSIFVSLYVRTQNSECYSTWVTTLSRQSVQKHLIDTAQDPADRARLLASNERESGYWLNAIPSTNIGTLLDRTTFTLAVSLRLGAKINVPHRCRCGVSVDQLGHHGLSCQRSAGRLPRHASLNDVIRRALASVNVPATTEPPGLVRDDGRRPDGMTLLAWKNGRPLVWDATCVDTLAPSRINATATRAGAAAAAAEASKRRRYAALGDGYYTYLCPSGSKRLGHGDQMRDDYSKKYPRAWSMLLVIGGLGPTSDSGLAWQSNEVTPPACWGPFPTAAT